MQLNLMRWGHSPPVNKQTNKQSKLQTNNTQEQRGLSSADGLQVDKGTVEITSRSGTVLRAGVAAFTASRGIASVPVQIKPERQTH